jgi:hypothetical protein
MMSKDKIVWMEVALTAGEMEAQIIAGLLRTAEIPSYIENGGGLLSTLAFGQMGLPARVFVPEAYYETALDLLDEDDDIPSLDEPGIKFK